MKRITITAEISWNETGGTERSIDQVAEDLKDLLEDATGFAPMNHYKVRVISRSICDCEMPKKDDEA